MGAYGVMLQLKPFISKSFSFSMRNFRTQKIDSHTHTHTQSACKGKIVTCNEVKIEQSIQQMECLLYFVLLRSYYKWFKWSNRFSTSSSSVRLPSPLSYPHTMCVCCRLLLIGNQSTGSIAMKAKQCLS